MNKHLGSYEETPTIYPSTPDAVLNETAIYMRGKKVLGLFVAVLINDPSNPDIAIISCLQNELDDELQGCLEEGILSQFGLERDE